MATLADAQIQAFFDEGLCIQRGVFGHSEVSEMRAAFERLQATASQLPGTQDHKGSRFVLADGRLGPGERASPIQRVVWCGAAEPVLLRYGQDPRLLEMASQILGSASMQHLINQAHFKLPNDGVSFDWHQDSQHRRFDTELWRDVNGKGSYVQMVLAIDDVNQENGPVRFIPRSCQLGHISPAVDGQALIDRLPPGLADPQNIVTPTLSVGDVALFGPYVVHGSLPNTSDAPRRVLVNGFAYPGANDRVYPGEGSGAMVSFES